MTVRIAMQVGMRKIIGTAERFGVVDKMAPELAMALGAGETTPFRMAGGYSSFVNGGRKVDPHLIELVENRDGKSHLPGRPARLQRLYGAPSAAMTGPI